jgi:excinuclease ABC subunit B
MGRASRNVNGTVLLFADNMTESLQKAIDETNRRRGLQEEFNKEHGITPKSVTRKIEEDLRIVDPLGDLDERRETKDERWDEFDESDDEDALRHPERSEESSEGSQEFTPGIRPMEPLQPSNYRKKSATGKRKGIPASAGMTGNDAEMTGNSASRHPRADEGLSSKLAALEKQMKEAAARLDFEEAARIRDIIRSMNG